MSINSINSTFAINSTNLHNITSTNQPHNSSSCTFSSLRWSRGGFHLFLYELLLQTPKAEVRAVLNKIIKKAIRCDGGVTLRGLPGQELRRRPPLQAHVPRGLHKGEWHIRNQRCPLCRKMFWKEDIRVLK